MNRVAWVVVGVAALIGCRDQSAVTSPRGLSADFSDGSVTGGNAHFFFLPPLTRQPTFTGTFNPNLRPVVDICQLVVDASGNPLQCDAAAPEIDSGTVQLDLIDQLYQVDWRTDQPAVDLTKFYRIQVRGAPRAKQVLGFADIAPVANGSALKNVNTGQYIGLVDGRTLPIKFRIETGAFCKTAADCGEATIGAGGGTVITNTGLAGALLPPGALAADVVVTIEAVTERPCLPIDLLQRSGCYQFSTDPGPNTFTQQVTAGICVDIEGLTPTEISLLHLHQLDFVEEAPVVTPLPNVAAHFLTCDEPHPSPTSVGLGGTLERGVRALVSLFTPQPLFAAHVGVGGLTGSFSRIGWALPAQMSIQAGDGQTAPTGTAVTTPPSVVVKDSSGAPVPGEAVTFSVGSGGGSVTGGTVTTDATGVATVGGWTLGPSAGANTLIAISRGAVGSAVPFTATGTAAAAIAHLADLTLIGAGPGNRVALDDAVEAGSAGQAIVVSGSTVNGTNTALSPLNEVAFIDQGDASRYENSSPVCVASGILPAGGTCGFELLVAASSAFTLPGRGTFVPGPATLRVELTQGTTVLDVVRIPITLANALVRIDDVSLSSTSLPLGGSPVPYTITITNETGITLNQVFVNGFVFQPGALVDGGAYYVVGCGPNPGDLLPGTCIATMGLSRSGPINLALSVPLSPGSTLSNGSAAAMFRIDESFCCAFKSVESTLAVTLVSP